MTTAKCFNKPLEKIICLQQFLISKGPMFSEWLFTFEQISFNKAQNLKIHNCPHPSRIELKLSKFLQKCHSGLYISFSYPKTKSYQDFLFAWINPKCASAKISCTYSIYKYKQSFQAIITLYIGRLYIESHST